MSSRAIQILIRSVKHHTGSLRLTLGGKDEQQMEVDIKQQKVDNQETIQALLLVYNKPSLIRSQEGSVLTFG